VSTVEAIVVAVVIIVVFLLGIKLMQSPRTALRGNRLGALAMGVAILFTVYTLDAFQNYSMWLFVFLGGVVGIILGQKVKMIQMPQTVALLNGLGGGASALVAWAAANQFAGEGQLYVIFFWITATLALGVGSLTLSGSIVAALKLQGWIRQRPLFFKGQDALLKLLLLAGTLLIIFSPFRGERSFTSLGLLLTLIFAVYGIVLTLRVGGADMPVVISFLNSLSGVAASVSGMAVGDALLAGTGALVGVAGLILTQIMCLAMNRNLASVLGGLAPALAPGKQEAGEAGKDKDKGVEPADKTASLEDEREKEEAPAQEKEASAPVEEKEEAVPAQEQGEAAPAGEAEEEEAASNRKLARLLHEARKVIIVPGYGMALAQAQQAVKNLIDTLEARGKEVKVGIHPVAGRMPGHMHVLLAEVGIDYEKLYDMEVINPEFAKADLVIVVGACDVINPAAQTVEGTPLTGMPILKVSDAKSVIVCNRDEKPGYSGVDNILYQLEKVITIWGDASETVPRLTAMLNGKAAPVEAELPAGEEAEADRGLEAKEEEEAAADREAKEAGETDRDRKLARLLHEARKVIIVPGYGMALAQAQQAVKNLIDTLEARGKEVKVGIHPVAGRMPGHMHVLLAEVGIDYEKLYDMEVINPEFAQADLVIVVGACDVINPAAQTVEGTPLTGMPILKVSDAKSVIVCNRDEKPGYSGVDNILYQMEKVITIWGDASETVPRLTAMLNQLSR